MNKEKLKELADVAMDYFKSEKKAIELVQWASINDSRAAKMIKYLKNKPDDISDAEIRYEMCRIVVDELTR